MALKNFYFRFNRFEWREKMRKYIFGLILFMLSGMFFLTSTSSDAALPAAASLEQTSQVQESPNSEQTSEQDTEPQPEPGPSRGRMLPVRR